MKNNQTILEITRCVKSELAYCVDIWRSPRAILIEIIHKQYNSITNMSNLFVI